MTVAFDTAGCPALLTGKELDAWIAYARELEGEDDSQGPPFFHGDEGSDCEGAGEGRAG